MVLGYNMSDLTVCTVNYNTSKYIRFQDRILRGLASNDGFKRIIVDTSSSSDLSLLSGLPETEIASIDTGTRYGSETHGFGVNWLIKHVNTEYALLIDPDAVLLLQNWDSLLKAELRDNCVAIGTPYNPLQSHFRHQDFPNAICFFFRVEPVCKMNINWEPMPYRWRNLLSRVIHSQLTRNPKFSIFAINDFEMGWRVPGVFRRTGYTAKHFDFVQTGEPVSILLGPDDRFEEYHWKGQLIATHQRRSQHPFNATPHSRIWVSATSRYLSSLKITVPATLLEGDNTACSL